MAGIKIDSFGGIIPRVHPTMLPDGMATTAYNCRLKNGKLVPLREPSPVIDGSSTVYFENGLSEIHDAHSIYCWKHTLKDGSVRVDFLAFPGRVYFAHGNIADDEYDRVFVTGETGVRHESTSGVITENAPAVYLFDRESNTILRHPLVAEPLQRPNAKVVSEPTGEGLNVSAYFFFSWFDEFGYESELSEPSKNMAKDGSSYTDDPLVYDGTSATISFQPIVYPGNASGVRIYKTNQSNSVSDIQFVKEFSSTELPLLLNEFKVKVNDTQLGEIMPGIEMMPPDILDMTFVPGNFYAARSKSMPHTVLFSDVDMPTSWPLAFRYDIRDNIVKIAVTSNTVFALTDGFPYVLNGTDPGSMVSTSIAGPAACISEKAVCVYRNAVYFVSNYGIYVIFNDANAGTVCQCITDRHFTKEQWQALNPSSAIMGQFDNALHIFFHLKDGSYKAMIIDLSDNTVTVTEHDEMATCLCTDDRSDDLYFVRQYEGTEA